MKIYIGNPTAQDREISCRPVESAKNLTMKVPAGRQAFFGDFTDPQIASIKEQLGVYGLLTVDEAMRARKPTHYLYAVDKPISASNILKVLERNKEIMKEDGALRRKAAAINAGLAVDGTLVEHADTPTRALEMSLEQERGAETRDGASAFDDKPIGEGVRFHKDGEPSPTAPVHRGPGRPRKIAA